MVKRIVCCGCVICVVRGTVMTVMPIMCNYRVFDVILFIIYSPLKLLCHPVAPI